MEVIFDNEEDRIQNLLKAELDRELKALETLETLADCLFHLVCMPTNRTLKKMENDCSQH